jgi:predicted dithiol-disulfide oxidoreductase (DUF899 family)
MSQSKYPNEIQEYREARESLLAEERELVSHKDEFPGGGLKRRRDVPVYLRIWDIARWAGTYRC